MNQDGLSMVDDEAPDTSNSLAANDSIQGYQQRRRNILVTLVLLLGLQVIVVKVNHTQQAALSTIRNFMALMHFMEGMRWVDRSNWRLHRHSDFLDQALLTTYNEREFKRRLRVKHSTFFYICSLVAPMMQKSNKGEGIALEKRVVVSLYRLGTRNYLLGCVDLFGMSEGATCIAVLDFCKAVLALIRPLVVPKYTKEALPQLAKKFEEKHGLPFIMGEIDGSHIPIIAPPSDLAPFYNRKGFYSVLLQGVVDTETVFWDWDFGWAGSLHDYTLFVNSQLGMKTIAGAFLPFKLIGDAAYPFRTCMYVPFKGTKEQLEPYKAHWNFIQSSTRMCVERAFGVLKGRWRILLRRIEMKLEHIADAVGACICLHNLCIMHKDFGDDEMLDEAKKWLRYQHIHSFSDLQQSGTMKIYEYGKAEIQRSTINVEDLIRTAAQQTPEDFTVEMNAQDTSSVLALKNGVTMHTQLAKALFSRHLREQVSLPPSFFEEDSNSDSSDDHP